MSSTRGRCCGAAGVCLVLAAGVSVAHDEDWRKIQDQLPAVEGPIWRLDPMRASAAEPFGAARGSQFPSEGVTLLSWIPVNNFSGNHASGNDCWGYVSPSGREYAIMGLARGYGFVEITNPVNPQIVGSITGPNSLWHDIKVLGEYAYGVSEGGSGIQVIDLSDIDNGNVTLVQNRTQAGHSTTHNIIVNEDSGYLYLAGANISNGGLIAVSTADPANPTIVGAWSGAYVHDAQVVTWEGGTYDGREIAFCANGGRGLEVLDVTNKSNMVKIGGSSWSGVRYGHQCWLEPSTNLLYVNDELDEGASVSVTTTRVFDVSNPANPSLVDTFTTGLPTVDHNLYIRDGLLFESNYTSGLRIFDIASNPTDPEEIAWFDTAPGSNSTSFNGAWSNYPFFPSGRVIISDIESGLFVVDVDAIEKPIAISYPTTPNFVPDAQSRIVATISDDDDVLDESSVELHFSVNGGNEVVLPMTDLGNGEFEGYTWPMSCGSNVSYYVSASSDAGAPFFGSVQNATVATAFITVLDLDFEANPGWSVDNTQVSEGAWVRGVPAQGGTRGDPAVDADGSGRCWITGNTNDEDLDGGPTVLTTSAYDLSSYDNVTFGYTRWFSNDDNDADALVVSVSDDNGASWTTVESVQGVSGWTPVTFNLSDFVSATSEVRFRFSASDNPNDSVTEAAIDAFHITSLDCTVDDCQADWNGDTLTDIFDITSYLGDFSGGDTSADVNGDTILDIFDVLDFLAIFEAGC